MSYQALYRVWRPQRFSDLVGQEHIAQTLKNALTSGRLSHAYLFDGPRGTGKTSAAKILAKAVNCLNGPSCEPCNDCEVCKGITEGVFMDVVEIDAASNRGVDEIRDLRDKVKYAPTDVRFKVYIIDEVHMLTTEAFNALLKTLEEPPQQVVFILATTEPHKLPLTILSRCQRFSFRRISLEKIAKRLGEICKEEGIEAEEGALLAIARIADGGMRDSLSILDQCLSLNEKRLEEKDVHLITGTISQEAIHTIFGAIINHDSSQALDCLDQCILEGFDPERMMGDMIYCCRNLLMVQKAPSMMGVGVGAEKVRELSQDVKSEELMTMLDLLISYQNQMKWSPYPRFLLELVLVRMCETQVWEENERSKALEERVSSLEKEIVRLKYPGSPAETEENVENEKGKKLHVTSMSFKNKWIGEVSEERTHELRNKWSEILQRVKEEKITVHAWLVDGEVVGVTSNEVIVSFKSKIHRDTTEKEANKALIERIIQKVSGVPTTLKTCMFEDWEGVTEVSGEKDEGALGYDPEEVVEKAIEVFGEDIVEVNND